MKKESKTDEGFWFFIQVFIDLVNDFPSTRWLGVPTFKKIRQIWLGDTYVYQTIFCKDSKNSFRIQIEPCPLTLKVRLAYSILLRGASQSKNKKKYFCRG